MDKQSFTADEDKALRERCFENACKSSTISPLNDAIRAYEFIKNVPFYSVSDSLENVSNNTSEKNTVILEPEQLLKL